MFLSLQTSSCSHKRFAFSCLIRYTVIQSLYRFLCSRIIRRVCCTSLYTKGVIKRMDRLFNMDNKFFTVMGRVADLIMLNVVFLICCLPIVTIGASLTALHYVTLKWHVTKNLILSEASSNPLSRTSNRQLSSILSCLQLQLSFTWICVL